MEGVVGDPHGSRHKVPQTDHAIAQGLKHHDLLWIRFQTKCTANPTPPNATSSAGAHHHGEVSANFQYCWLIVFPVVRTANTSHPPISPATLNHTHRQ